MSLATIVAAVHAKLATAGVACEVGAEYLSRQAAPPRITWVFAKETQEHDGEYSGGISELAGDGLRRQVATRKLIVEAHVWAATTAAADSLLGDLIAAALRTLGSSCRLGGAVWPKQTQHQQLKRGENAVQVFTISVPVFDPPIISPPSETVTLEQSPVPPFEWTEPADLTATEPDADDEPPPDPET